MDGDELWELHRLLTKWIDAPDWDADSAAWATVVECRRQVEIDLRAAGAGIPW